MAIQAEFRDLVSAIGERCQKRFETRLYSTYLAGSTAVAEALPGISDLDWWAFIRDEPSSADQSWRRRTQKQLEIEIPVASEVHINVFSIKRLRQESFWRFILRYNTARLSGPDLIAELEQQGLHTPRPDRILAKSRLPFVRQCLTDAIAGKNPQALGELPANPFLVTRKLARNFVIVEGAFVLMCNGAFRSFKQEVVLEGIVALFPQWRPLIQKVEAISSDPNLVGIHPSDLMTDIEPFIEWAISIIEKA